MSVKETILQVTVAALAVIGFYGVLHALFACLLTPRELAVAVVVDRPMPPEELDILLCEARRTPVGRGKRVVLLLSSAVLSRESDPDGELREAYAELVEKYGVTVCLCEETPHP
jgi:hypothetical protein